MLLLGHSEPARKKQVILCGIADASVAARTMKGNEPAPGEMTDVKVSVIHKYPADND